MTTRRAETLDRLVTIQTTTTTPFTRRFDTAPARLGGQTIYGDGAFALDDGRLTVAQTDADGAALDAFASGEGLRIEGGGESETVIVTTAVALPGAWRAVFSPDLDSGAFGDEVTVTYTGRTGSEETTERTAWARRMDLTGRDGLALGAIITPSAAVGGQTIREGNLDLVDRSLNLATDSRWLLRFRADLRVGGNFTDDAGQVWGIRAVAETERRRWMQILARRVTV